MPIRNGQIIDWKHKIQIKDLLSNSDDPENAKQVAKQIFARLNKKPFMRAFMDLDYFQDLDDENPIEHINELLDSLYDYCDRYLIWVN